MKGYTDFEQSKRLAEILPIESADMTWVSIYDESHMMSDYRIELMPYRFFCGVGFPAWSLSALMAQMPCVELEKSENHKYRVFWLDKYSDWHTNAVDACVELLERVRKEEGK